MVNIFGLNLTATIKRPTKIRRSGGDRETVSQETIASDVLCTLQEAAKPQQYLPGGQVAIRVSRIWFRYGVDVQENDFVTLSDETEWRIEHVMDDAGRHHHLICEVKAFT